MVRTHEIGHIGSPDVPEEPRAKYHVLLDQYGSGDCCAEGVDKEDDVHEVLECVSVAVVRKF